jgi:hypothetical protein
VVTKPSIERDGTRVTKDIHLYLMRITGNSKSIPEEKTVWLTIDEAKPLMVPQEVAFLETIEKELTKCFLPSQT